MTDPTTPAVDESVEIERLRAVVNAVVGLYDRLSRERPYSLGSGYVDMLRRCLSVNPGCDPWGLPCPDHGDLHWRDALAAARAREAALTGEVERLTEAADHSRSWADEQEARAIAAEAALDALREAVPDAVRDAIADLASKATQYGTTQDGDTAAYLIPKGTMHRLMHVMQNAGAAVAFRAVLAAAPSETETGR